MQYKCALFFVTHHSNSRVSTLRPSACASTPVPFTNSWCSSARPTVFPGHGESGPRSRARRVVNTPTSRSQPVQRRGYRDRTVQMSVIRRDGEGGTFGYNGFSAGGGKDGLSRNIFVSLSVTCQDIALSNASFKNSHLLSLSLLLLFCHVPCSSRSGDCELVYMANRK